jgi:SARP family transcriptional regulator, regulator of embCAB operon
MHWTKPKAPCDAAMPGPWGLANTAAAIAQRPFLIDAEAPWIEGQRATLRSLHLRALQCLVLMSTGREPSLAASHAEEMIAIEPLRETSYRLLMQAHAAAGDYAEATRAFERCRTLLRTELGIGPAPQTEAAYREIRRPH